ncbi:hypothetical protein [Anabaena sp. CCY 9402-a]
MTKRIVIKPQQVGWVDGRKPNTIDIVSKVFVGLRNKTQHQ